MSSINTRIQSVRERVRMAARESGRNENDILLLAVTKTHDMTAIKEAMDCGIFCFGENYVQEGVEKISKVTNAPIEWHFLGPLQSNKTRIVAYHFDWVHSLDRIKVAERLSKQRPPTLPPLNVCIQVNLDNQPTKTGLQSNTVASMIHHIISLPQIKVRGLMAIPEPRQTHNEQRKIFAQLSCLKEEINIRLDKSQKLDTLSMGMSSDLEAAIQEGSTIVRVGTDIFGPRKAKGRSEQL